MKLQILLSIALALSISSIESMQNESTPKPGPDKSKIPVHFLPLLNGGSNDPKKIKAVLDVLANQQQSGIPVEERIKAALANIDQK